VETTATLQETRHLTHNERREFRKLLDEVPEQHMPALRQTRDTHLVALMQMDRDIYHENLVRDYHLEWNTYKETRTEEYLHCWLNTPFHTST
jgi:hypothetical protein